ncbi:MAG: NAD(P)H-hydrate dehydratase [Pseudorhodobacter sp.]
MTELLTAAQMRAIEGAAISSGDVTGLELMERAGKGVVEAIFEEWPEFRTTFHRAAVLCGPGNNGGDGYVVARLLKSLGWEVEVFHYGDPSRLPPDARVNYERWCEVGAAWPLSALGDRPDWQSPLYFDLAVDALFGTGLSRPVPNEVKSVLCAIVRGDFVDRCVSVDMPSGLCSDSGRVLLGNPRDGWDPAVNGWVCEAGLTVCFHRPKLGLIIGEGYKVAGKLVVKSIGLGSQHRLTLETEATVVNLAASNPFEWDKRIRGHKYVHGHALIISGGIATGGAARLAARGALRIGAGVVTLGCPPSALTVNAAQLNAVMVKPIHDAEALEAMLADKRINALCLGPGMGTGTAEAQLLSAALRRRGEPRPTVLDADALSLLAGDARLFDALHDACVLTPHAGEFARLFPDIAARLAEPATNGPAYSKVDATREAAKRAGCVVLLKGPDTVIADPSGRCSINAAVYDRAAPWLATAGAGDVLAGFITGLLARGFAPMQAAESGTWLHVECARSFGPGLIAEDLPEELPKVFRALGL